MGEYVARSRTVKEALIYEAFIKFSLDYLGVDNEYEPHVKNLIYRPDLVIPKGDKPRIVMLVTHVHQRAASSNKFYETLNEVAELKLFGVRDPSDVISVCVLFGKKESWADVCLQGFPFFFDHVIYGWDHEFPILSLIYKELNNMQIADRLSKSKIERIYSTIQILFRRSPPFKELVKRFVRSSVRNPLKYALNPEATNFWYLEKNDIFPKAKVRKWKYLFSKDTERYDSRNLFHSSLKLLPVLDPVCENIVRELLIKPSTLKKLCRVISQSEPVESELSFLVDYGLILKKPTLAGEVYELSDSVTNYISSVEELSVFENSLKQMVNLIPELLSSIELIKGEKLDEKIQLAKQLTNNFKCSTQDLAILISKCSVEEERNWLLEVLIALSPLKLRVLASDSRDSALAGVQFTQKIPIQNARILARLLKSSIDPSIPTNIIKKNILMLRRLKLLANIRIHPLRIAVALQLKNAGLSYRGFPDETLVSIGSFLQEKFSPKGRGGNITVPFLVDVNEKKIAIQARATEREHYHRTGEMSGRLRCSKYCMEEDSIVRRADIDKFLLVLDGNWILGAESEKWIKRLYCAGFDEIFLSEPLHKEWKLIEYLKEYD